MTAPAWSEPPSMYAEDLLRLTRRDLDIGMTWWVNPEYVASPAHAYVISTLESEGYPVDRSEPAVLVTPKQTP